MAKVSLNKLIPKGNDNSKIETTIINGEQVIVIGYLPIDAKSKLIEMVLSYTFDNNGIMSPVRQEAAFYVGLIKYYTNINITDKMMEDMGDLYDKLASNGIIEAVISYIPKAEYEAVYDLILESVDAVERYNYSLVGMMNTINSNFNITEDRVKSLMSDLGDQEKVGLVKDILDKIG